MTIKNCINLILNKKWNILCAYHGQRTRRLDSHRDLRIPRERVQSNRRLSNARHREVYRTQNSPHR